MHAVIWRRLSMHYSFNLHLPMSVNAPEYLASWTKAPEDFRNLFIKSQLHFLQQIQSAHKYIKCIIALCSVGIDQSDAMGSAEQGINRKNVCASVCPYQRRGLRIQSNVTRVNAWFFRPFSPHTHTHEATMTLFTLNYLCVDFCSYSFTFASSGGGCTRTIIVEIGESLYVKIIFIFL